MQLQDHPTVRKVQDVQLPPPVTVDVEFLRRLCREAGADDVGFVAIEDAALGEERLYAEQAMVGVRAMVSMVFRMNREPIRSPFRSVANLEFHQTGDVVNEACRHVVAELEKRGVRALNAAMGFPMEMDRWTRDRSWVVAHKTVAVAAGLGKMGIHRNVIHPRFGNFILLGTVLLDAPLTAYSPPLDYNPCLECKLCVAACPTGAIHADGGFDFAACYTHNYREFMSGFTDWVENVADSKSAADYRARVSDAESVSMWQSLAFGPNYKAAYCLSVCPAGEDVIGPFLRDRKSFLDEVVRPLQDKVETVYVVAGSDAEEYVAKRFPHKESKRVHNGLRSSSIRGFLFALPRVFQRGRSRGLRATYHFTFVGEESAQATVIIDDGSLRVLEGLQGEADLALQADSHTWLRLTAGQGSMLWGMLRRRVRVRGPMRLLLAFARCFPR